MIAKIPCCSNRLKVDSRRYCPGIGNLLTVVNWELIRLRVFLQRRLCLDHQ